MAATARALMRGTGVSTFALSRSLHQQLHSTKAIHPLLGLSSRPVFPASRVFLAAKFAALSKESRMKLAGATSLNRKSGGATPRDLGLSPSQAAPDRSSHLFIESEAEESRLTRRAANANRNTHPFAVRDFSRAGPDFQPGVPAHSRAGRSASALRETVSTLIMPFSAGTARRS